MIYLVNTLRMWLPCHLSQGLMIKVCDNLVLYYIHNYDSYIYKYVGFWEVGKPRSISGEKPSKHRRDRLRQLKSYETQVQPPTGLNFFQWWEETRWPHVPPVLPKMYLTSFSEMKHSYNTRFHPKKRFSFPKVRTITMENSTYVTMDQEFEMVIRTHILRQFKNKRRELLARTKWWI